MLDALITTGTAASRAEAVGWVLARIRERPAYARLEERARELDQLKAHFCLRKREAPLQRQVRQR
jgi:predicted lipoprotein